MLEPARSGEKVLRGIPVSPGVSRGRILVLGKALDEPFARKTIPEAEIPAQIHRLQTALVQTRQQIHEVQRQVTEALGSQDATIFDAHLLILEDPTLIDEVTRMISEEKVTAEFAFKVVSDHYIKALNEIEDDY